MSYNCTTCGVKHRTGFVCKKPKHYFNKLQPLNKDLIYAEWYKKHSVMTPSAAYTIDFVCAKFGK